MALKHKPFEKLIPEWEKKGDEKEVKKEKIIPTELNSSELTPNSEGLIEQSVEGSILGRVDASTSIGGPRSKYTHDEDAFAIRSTENELAVAVLDGAGGSGNGALASRIGARTFLETIKQGDDLMDSFDEITDNVLKEGKGGYLTGTALHAVKLPEGTIRINVANSGDTRILTVRGGERFGPGTTTLQNLGQTAIRLGEIEPWEYYNYPMKHIMTGSLGIEEQAEPPEFRAFDHEEGDVSILASDGLWDVVSEYEVIQLAKKYKGKELHEKLFELAFERNNSEAFDILHSPDHLVLKRKKLGDNITIVVVG